MIGSVNEKLQKEEKTEQWSYILIYFVYDFCSKLKKIKFCVVRKEKMTEISNPL